MNEQNETMSSILGNQVGQLKSYYSVSQRLQF